MRIFVALPLPKDIRLALVRLCGGIAGTRWVEPNNFHITLRFCGDANRHSTDDFHLELSAVRFPEFELALRGIGIFERRGHIHMLWAGLDAPQSVNELRDRIEAAAVRSGFQPESRKFTPHITLCRFKPHSMPDVGSYLEMNNAFSTDTFTIDRFNLYQSRLGHGGARYEVLSEYALNQRVYYGDDALNFAD